MKIFKPEDTRQLTHLTSAYLISLCFLQEDLPGLDIEHLHTTGGPRVEIQVEVPLEAGLFVIPTNQETQLIFTIQCHSPLN